MHYNWGHHSDMSKLCRYQSWAITRGFMFCCFLVFNAQVTFLTAIMTLTPYIKTLFLPLFIFIVKHNLQRGSSVGAVVRAFTFHHHGLGLISWPAVICGMSLLVLFVLCFERFFPQVLRFSPLSKNQHEILIWFVVICCDSVWLVVSSIRKATVLCLIQWDLNKVISIIFVEL